MADEFKPGQKVRLKSGTEGWVDAEIVEFTELYPEPGFLGRSPLGGFIYTGPEYKVKVLTGKHAGETIRVPVNYIQATGAGLTREGCPYKPSPWR